MLNTVHEQISRRRRAALRMHRVGLASRVRVGELCWGPPRAQALLFGAAFVAACVLLSGRDLRCEQRALVGRVQQLLLLCWLTVWEGWGGRDSAAAWRAGTRECLPGAAAVGKC